jgi:hypothetical protein
MEGTQWTRWFMWFGPPKRNTLRPRESYCIDWCVSFKLALHLLEWTWTWLLLMSTHPFIAQGWVATL